jgi:hypothetical protein
MSFAPVLSGGGIPGWAMLQRTRSNQTAVLAAHPKCSATPPIIATA